MLKAIVTTALASTVLMVSTISSEVKAQTRNPNVKTTTPSTVQVSPTREQTPNRVVAPSSNDSTKIETTCTGTKSCNDFIALCVASGGDFVGNTFDSQGRPSTGTCKS